MTNGLVVSVWTWVRFKGSKIATIICKEDCPRITINTSWQKSQRSRSEALQEAAMQQCSRGRSQGTCAAPVLRSHRHSVISPPGLLQRQRASQTRRAFVSIDGWTSVLWFKIQGLRWSPESSFLISFRGWRYSTATLGAALRSATASLAPHRESPGFPPRRMGHASWLCNSVFGRHLWPEFPLQQNRDKNILLMLGGNEGGNSLWCHGQCWHSDRPG